MPPAARVGDLHACPVGTHVGGPVRPPGSASVIIGGQPAARAGDRATCAGPADLISQGSPTVFIDGRPAARVGDRCGHTGLIVTGCSTVIIGNGVSSSESVSGPVTAADRWRGGGRLPRTGEPSPGSPPPTSPSSPTTPEDPAATPPSGSGKGANGDGDGANGLRLFGMPVTLEFIQAIAALAQQLIPGFAARQPPVDPQAITATIAELRAAIASGDEKAINDISARLTAMVQRGGAVPTAEPPAQSPAGSPWTPPENK